MRGPHKLHVVSRLDPGELVDMSTQAPPSISQVATGVSPNCRSDRLITGTNGEGGAVEVPRILAGANDREESPVASHGQIALARVGAGGTRRGEVNRIGAHIHLNIARFQEYRAITGW